MKNILLFKGWIIFHYVYKNLCFNLSFQLHTGHPQLDIASNWVFSKPSLDLASPLLPVFWWLLTFSSLQDQKPWRYLWLFINAHFQSVIEFFCFFRTSPKFPLSSPFPLLRLSPSHSSPLAWITGTASDFVSCVLSLPSSYHCQLFLVFSVTQSKKDLLCSNPLPPYPGLAHTISWDTPRQIPLFLVPESALSIVSSCPSCAALFTWSALLFVLHWNPSISSGLTADLSFARRHLWLSVHADVSLSHTLVLPACWN